jgi:hypothetical protein
MYAVDVLRKVIVAHPADCSLQRIWIVHLTLWLLVQFDRGVEGYLQVPSRLVIPDVTSDQMENCHFPDHATEIGQYPPRLDPAQSGRALPPSGLLQMTADHCVLREFP